MVGQIDVFAQPPSEFQVLRKKLDNAGWRPQNEVDYWPALALSEVWINGERVELRANSQLQVIWCAVGDEVMIAANETKTVSTDLGFSSTPARFVFGDGTSASMQISERLGKIRPLEQSSERVIVKPAKFDRRMMVFQQGYQFETSHGKRTVFVDKNRKVFFVPKEE